MSNLQDCAKIKDMTAAEAAAALKTLAGQIRGPVGLGIWEGTLTGKISGQTHGGEQIAVFRNADLIAPFGPRGDEESEACAALFAVALMNADKIERLATEHDELHAAYVERINIGATRQQRLEDAIARETKMREALEAIKARLDRNGMSGRQLPEYNLIAEALAQPQDAA